MAKRFTPIIGLAVVVALAMVAVFGAMSLANPAFAAIGQPADAELTERTFSPQQDATVEVAAGEVKSVPLTITGGLTNYDEDAAAPTVTATPTGCSTGAITARIGSVVMTVTGGDTATTSCRLTASVPLDEGDLQRVRVDVTVVEATSVSATGDIPDQRVPVGDDDYELDVANYFTAGRGTNGNITGYGASNPAAADGGGDIVITNPTEAATVFTIDTTDTDGNTPAANGDSFFVTITATDAGTAEATQTLFIDVVSATEEVGDMPTVTPSSGDPGENTKYTVTSRPRATLPPALTR